jgi:hypothetical protein
MRENQTFIQDFLRHPDGCEKISLFTHLKECIKKSVQNFHSLDSDALSPIVVSGMWEFKDVFARLDVKTLNDGGQVRGYVVTRCSTITVIAFPCYAQTVGLVNSLFLHYAILQRQFIALL